MNRVKERIVNADTSFAQNIFFHCDTPRFKFGKPRQSSGERKDGKKKKNFRAAKSFCACGAVSPRSGVSTGAAMRLRLTKNEGGQHTPMLPASYFLLYLFTPSPIGEIDCL